MKTLTNTQKLLAPKDNFNLRDYSARVLIVDTRFSSTQLKKHFDEKTAAKISNFLVSRKFKFKAKNHLTFDLTSKQKFSILVLPKNLSVFSSLELSREVLTSLKVESPVNVLIFLIGTNDSQEKILVDSFTSAAKILNYEPPKYKTPSKKEEPQKKEKLSVSFKLSHARLSGLEKILESSRSSAEKTNLVRHLVQRAGNDLTPAVYVATATELAKKAGLKTEFFSFNKLEEMKAGAFVAVAKGSGHNSSGILKISYQPKTAKKKIALVGKGITFDTGGNNLKTGPHMFGMNNDMGGSAVALALCLLAAQEKWSVQITGYLAITENLLTASAYRPNDVITSLKGKTIEVVDTDAEGRMILADTLTLASREKPHLVLDFATLTGSVIRALGTQYSGGYSNRKSLLRLIRRAGILSGERVWSFPNDSDYGRCLKSEIADIKQCRLSGGVDHIEAAYFLSQFVEKGVDWVHIDLGAMDPEEALGHIPKKPSGFGVRFGKELIHSL
ncbi:MAG: leucyl aminopeptidase family protein [Deltaproteobacteria bacterium]|nr:leucyl aminopeptidase family protein [Deltaproteobacteria bacterium]